MSIMSALSGFALKSSHLFLWPFYFPIQLTTNINALIPKTLGTTIPQKVFNSISFFHPNFLTKVDIPQRPIINAKRTQGIATNLFFKIKLSCILITSLAKFTLSVIKIISDATISSNPTAKSSFLKETNLSLRLTHFTKIHKNEVIRGTMKYLKYSDVRICCMISFSQWEKAYRHIVSFSKIGN